MEIKITTKNIQYMKSVFRSLLILGCFLILSSNLFAQHMDDDCMIYQKVLEYYNREYGKPVYVYTGEGGVIDPVNPKQDSFLRTGDHRYSFFIVEHRGRFGNPEVQSWFYDLMNDSTLRRHDYTSNKDSLIRCTFPNSLKYQYKHFLEIEFDKDDYFIEVNGLDTIQYAPIRITFSKVIYADNIALVYAGNYTGLGMAGDTGVRGFVYRKVDDEWVLEKSEWEVR